MLAPLVLVRWHGDIIATNDASPLKLEGPLPEGVTVEVIDVTAEKKSLSLRPAIPVLAIVGLLASILLHGGFAAAVLVAAWFFPPPPPAPYGGILPPQNDQAGAEAPFIKVAAGDPPPEPPKEVTPPKPEPTPPQPAAPPPEEIPTMVDEQASSPPPSLPEPEEAPPSDIVTDGANGSDDLTAGPTACARPPVVANKGPTCRRNVVFGAINKSPSCYVDVVAKENQTGVLTYPCNGDGAATLRFGNKSFTGAVVNGKVDVCTGTEYLFSDHCKWTSAQRVSGSVGEGQLHFTYGEGPKPGQHNCAQKCGATADITIGSLPN